MSFRTHEEAAAFLEKELARAAQFHTRAKWFIVKTFSALLAVFVLFAIISPWGPWSIGVACWSWLAGFCLGPVCLPIVLLSVALFGWLHTRKMTKSAQRHLANLSSNADASTIDGFSKDSKQEADTAGPVDSHAKLEPKVRRRSWLEKLGAVMGVCLAAVLPFGDLGWVVNLMAGLVLGLTITTCLLKRNQQRLVEWIQRQMLGCVVGRVPATAERSGVVPAPPTQ